MKKTGFIVALSFSLIALIGTGFALWHYSDASDSADSGLTLEGFIDDGDVVIRDFKVGNLATNSFALGNSERMLSDEKLITFDVLHTEAEDVNTRPESYVYSVVGTIDHIELASYLDIAIDYSSWTTSGTLATISARLSWKEGKEPLDLSSWNELNTILEEASATASSKIVFVATALGN